MIDGGSMTTPHDKLRAACVEVEEAVAAVAKAEKARDAAKPRAAKAKGMISRRAAALGVDEEQIVTWAKALRGES